MGTNEIADAILESYQTASNSWGHCLSHSRLGRIYAQRMHDLAAMYRALYA